MVRSNPFPFKQSELNRYLGLAVTYLHTHACRLGVPETTLNKLSLEHAAWVDAYAKRHSPSNPQAVYALGLAMDAILASLRATYATISADALTQDDREELNLRETSVGNSLERSK